MLSTAPVLKMEREKLMDILRGFAILGIFIANLRFFSLYDPDTVGTGFHYPFDKTMSFLHAMFIEGKFYTLFSLLFGWGMALQLQNASRQNINPAVLVKRRLRGMLLFGLLHLFVFWSGDIVAFYAMLGFILLLFRNMNDKKLLVWSVVLILSPILIYFLKMNFLWLNAPAGVLFETGRYVEQHLNNVSPDSRGITVSNTGSWTEIWKLNISGFFFRFAYLFFVSRISKVLGVFLIGYMIGRNGHYKKILGNRPLLIRVALAGFVIGLPCNYFLARFMENGSDYYNLKINGLYQTIVYAFGVVPLALSYAAIIALAYRSRLLKNILSLLQPVGKMAFSNYILHSLIGIITFYGIGFGLGGRFGPSAWTLFAIAVFIFQVFFSHLWLSYFYFGPVEWIWRSITYKQWQPMKKARQQA